MRPFFILTLFLLTITTYGQTNNEKIIKARNSKCLVVAQIFFPLDSLSINWDGDCKQKMANGQGTMTYFLNNVEVAKYQGLVSNGSPNGKGKFSSPNGFMWEGDFVNGVLNGQGRVVFPDTTKKLEGNFYDGEILNLDTKYLSLLKKNVISNNDSTDLYVRVF